MSQVSDILQEQFQKLTENSKLFQQEIETSKTSTKKKYFKKKLAKNNTALMKVLIGLDKIKKARGR